MPSVESITQMTIIEAKKGTKRKKVKMRKFLFNDLRYRDSYQIMIYIDCNAILLQVLLIKGHFKIRIKYLVFSILDPFNRTDYLVF